jgi:hypothetical protein
LWKDEIKFDEGDLWSEGRQDEVDEMDVSMEDISRENGEMEHRGKKREWDVDGDSLMEDEQVSRCCFSKTGILD